MNALLRGAPRLQRLYFQTRYLLQIAREVYLTDPVSMNDRSHREHEWNFAEGPDWARWQRVLTLVREQLGSRWGDVLEVGCAEGVGTVEIAKHAATLVAGDVSVVARERTAFRMRDAGHVRVVPLDLQRDPLDTYDVVFGMDVLEFIHGRRRVEDTIAKLARAVRPGGLLVISMCRYPPELDQAWWQRWVPEGADRVIPMITVSPGLHRVHLEPYPAAGESVPGYMDHLLAVFRRH